MQFSVEMKKSALSEKFSAFIRQRATNAIERQRVIVYMLHVVLIVTAVALQLLRMGGSQHMMLMSMSVLHLVTCLAALWLYLHNRMTIPQAMTLVTLVSQGCFAVRSYFLVTQHIDPHYLRLIIGYQVLTIIGLFFLVMAFVRITPFIVSGISLTVYVFTALYLREPSLWKIFSHLVFVELFISVVGELLRRNVMTVAKENKEMHHREAALMRAVRLNSREMEAYLRMGNNNDPTMKEADRFFAMLKPKSKRNLLNAVRLYLNGHIKDGTGLALLFPSLTKSERDVCQLILQGMKRREIATHLGKSEKNIDVVRTHVRRKLNVPADQELSQYLARHIALKEG